MTALFLPSKHKNLTWNTQINNVLFSSKHRVSLKKTRELEFLFNNVIKYVKTPNIITITKLLLSTMHLNHNMVWKLLLSQDKNNIFHYNKNINLEFNAFSFKIVYSFFKNQEAQVLYNETYTPGTFFDNYFTNSITYWLNVPRALTLKKVLRNNFVKTAKKFLTRRALTGLTISLQTPVTASNILITNNDENFFQHEDSGNNIVHVQYFNEKHLKTPLKHVYLLLKIEEKIEELAGNTETKAQAKILTEFYNFIHFTIKNKQERFFEKKILGPLDLFTKVKSIAPDLFFQFLQVKYKRQNNLQLNWTQNSIQHSNGFNLQTRSTFSRLNNAKIFNGKKLELENRYFKLNNTSKILNQVLNAKVNIFYINALALAKFGYILENQKGNILLENLASNPTKFLNNLDREMISKYKYIGVYIKDLIRVCFVSLFLKKPAFLAKFIAFQISVLPKNRRETSFVRFLIKVIKTLAAEREEILGLRIKFKGRVNRWRRTKIILGQRGILPLHTIYNRIEYGTAQAINRKGALGIHIWIWYNPMFKNILKETYKKYFKYSNYLNNTTKY